MMTDPYPDGQAPLLEALLAHLRSGRHSWHMPGHNAGQAWPAWFREQLAQMDLTELPSTDDLNRPAGPAKAAMELAAEAFGAGLTRLITGGSTAALYCLLACAVGPGGTLLVARTCHRSVLNAAALLHITLLPLTQTGLPPPDDTSVRPRLTLLPQATAAAVAKALTANPHCQAVLLTSPDYYGGCAATQAIAQVVHRHGALLLVDEAHGAHLPFDRDRFLPLSALAAGADACVQSGHKTLPVLTGGAYLHISRDALASGLLTAAALDRLIPVFQSSSPSFPIAASLDYARHLLTETGAERIREQLMNLAEFRVSLHGSLICQPDRKTFIAADTDRDCLDRDPLRLVITTRDDADVSRIQAMAQKLSDSGIDIEFADLTRLILIPSLWQQTGAWRKLAQVLNSCAVLPADSRETRRRSDSLLAVEGAWRGFWEPRQSEQVMPLPEALLGRRPLCQLSVDNAAGRIAAQPIAPYPPGLAIIWPGERIDQDRVDFLRLLIENRISISGVDEGKVYVFA